MKNTTSNNEGFEKKTYPDVKFELDLELDIWKIKTFSLRTDKPGGMDPAKLVLDKHPMVAIYNEKPLEEGEKLIRAYVEEIYNKKIEKLKNLCRMAKDCWEINKEEFYRTCARLIPNTAWPDGKYAGYITISPPCPRFLDLKTFQFPAADPEVAVRVAIHEMVHFIFFEYIRSRYLPQLINPPEKEMQKLLEGKFIAPIWGISEAFNIMVLTHENFSIYGPNHPTGYTQLMPLKEKMEVVWKECGENIDQLFDNLEAKV